MLTALIGLTNPAHRTDRSMGESDRGIQSIDTFRGFTIFAMIFVIMVAGYQHLPLTFPHFGSAPVSTFKHAGNDGDAAEWAFWEGRTPARTYRPAKVVAESAGPGAQGRRLYDVAVVNERGESEIVVHGAEIRTARPLRPNEKIIAVLTPPAAGTASVVGAPYRFEQIGIGCTFTDLVAPFFVFIVGLCIPLSRQRRQAGWWKHVALRTTGLILAGMLYISLILKLSYWWGVLQAIGVAYLMAAVFMLLPAWPRWIAVGAVAALHSWATWHLSWWVTLGDPAKPFWTIVTPDGDMLRPLTVHCTPWASIAYGICAVVGTLLGEAVVTREKTTIVRRALAIGLPLTAAGYLLHLYHLPMSKDDVSSSYAIFTSGLAALVFLGVFLVVDVFGRRRWAGVFDVFGRNALLAYFMQPVVRIVLQALGLYQGFLGHAAWTGMLVGLGWTMLLWCAVLWCNRKGLYWKL